MRSTGWSALALCLLTAGCQSSGSGPEPSRRTVVSSFSGVVDAAAGTVTILPDAPSGSDARLAALVEIPVANDGVPNSGPPDTAELVTAASRTVTAGCGAVDGFEGDVRLRSFYAGAVLTNVHVELTGLTPTGREACNSAAPYEALSAALGLWDYGTIGRAGSGFDLALRTWRFRVPDQTRFVFHGHVVADLVTADGAPPTTVATPDARRSDRPQHCADGDGPTRPAARRRRRWLPGRLGSAGPSGRGHPPHLRPQRCL